MQEPDLCRSRRAASAALIQCRRVQGRSCRHHPCSTLLDGLIRGVLFSERVTIFITSYYKTEHDHNGDAAANYSAAPRSSTRWPRGGRASPQGYRTLVCGLCAFFLPVLRQAGAAAWRICRDNRMSVRITGHLGSPRSGFGLGGSLLLSRAASASCCCRKASYSGVPGRGGAFFGTPPADRGM